MRSKKLVVLNIAAAVFILMVNSIFIIAQTDMFRTGNIIKNCAVCFYYLIFFCFDKWLNVGIVVLSLLAFLLGVKLKKELSSQSLLCSLSGGLVLYGSIFVWMIRTEELLQGKIEYLLQGEYYLLLIYWMLLLGNYVRKTVVKTIKEKWVNENGFSYINLWKILLVLFILTLIPVLAVSPYIFPQGDDWSYSANAHLAFAATGSVCQGILEAAKMVRIAYFRNQGTFSSIFMMALQPGVFKEECYIVVPVLFVGVICISAYFFFRTLFKDYLEAENKYWITVLILYLIVAIQCIPSKATAFYWYNGAVHYIMAQAMLLCMLAFMLRIYMRKRLWSNCLGAVLTAVYVGGGNLISGVEGVVATGTILFALVITKNGKKYRAILLACLMNIIAFGINVAAPGNYDRVEESGAEMNLLQGFTNAFRDSADYMLGEWLHWSVLLFVIMCIPVLWRIVRKIKYHFKYPFIVIGYSWCYMAGMFFAPAFVWSGAQVGRYQNIMFLMYLFWIIIDLTYILGWLQRKYELRILVGNEKRYYIAAGFAAVIMLLPSMIAETEYYTFSFATQTLLSGDAREYGTVYRENIEILRNSTEDTVTLYELEPEPELFASPEMEPWKNGLRLFYNKSEINYVPWEK